MDMLKKINDSLTTGRKKLQHWWNPNENPNELDKYAFNLLDKAEVDLFIEFVNKNPVNVKVCDFNKASLLMKAAQIPSHENAHTKLLTYQEKEKRAIQAINYLVKQRGADVNYQGKNGITALMSASHWGYYNIVEALLKLGANPDLGSQAQNSPRNPFLTNPLLSAAFKQHKEVVLLLIAYGANPSITEREYNDKTSGYRLTQEQLNGLYSAYNVYVLTYKREIDQKKGTGSVLAKCSENMFNRICLYA